jgi:hypothetical protein
VAFGHATKIGEKTMDDMSLEVNIGSVTSTVGQLRFKFVVHNSGAAHLQIYAADPTDMRKSGVLLTLDETQYNQLKALIARTDQTIEKLRAAGQMKTMLARPR